MKKGLNFALLVFVLIHKIWWLVIPNKFANTIVLSIILVSVALVPRMGEQIVSAQKSNVMTSNAILSFGKISIPSPSVLISNELLALTGFGGDYLLTFEGGDPDEVWIGWGWIDAAASRLPNYNTSKLCFVFPGLIGSSVLD